uniref:Uncharacterized protein n=1 Tax=Bionectria ochroleuca TaxID=29856 RepID=A0A8H7KFI1_BIOOC
MSSAGSLPQLVNAFTSGDSGMVLSKDILRLVRWGYGAPVRRKSFLTLARSNTIRVDRAFRDILSPMGISYKGPTNQRMGIANTTFRVTPHLLMVFCESLDW